MTDSNLTTRDIAEALNINPRDLRIFLRAQGDTYTPPGSGGRYSFTKADVTKIRKEYAAWADADKKSKAEKAAARARAPRVVAITKTPDVVAS